MPEVMLLGEDIAYAMRIFYAKKGLWKNWFQYDDYSHNSPNFPKDEFQLCTIRSLALESLIKRTFSIERRWMEDYMPDLPNGVEVTVRSATNTNGGPYLIEKMGAMRPTVTAFALSDSKREIDIRYFVTPNMVSKLHITHTYPKPSGVKRHLVSRESAEEAGACEDIMRRLRFLVLGR